MLQTRHHLRVERKRALERFAQVGVSRAEKRAGVRQVLAQRPPSWPVAGEALRDRLQALMLLTRAIRHPCLDQETVALRELVSVCEILRSDRGVDRLLVEVSSEGVAPVRQPERAVERDSESKCVGGGLPAPADDEALSVQEGAECWHGARGDCGEARRRRVFLPELAEKPPG